MDFIGHIGQDATVTVIDGNRKVINFSVAMTEKWKNAQGVQMEHTTWVRCSRFTDNAQVAEYLKKGTQVYVTGKPSTNPWQGQDGQLHADLQCVVMQVQLLGSKRTDQQPVAAGSAPAQQQTPGPADLTQPMDDLPF